jgi:hypothetical protein
MWAKELTRGQKIGSWRQLAGWSPRYVASQPWTTSGTALSMESSGRCVRLGRAQDATTVRGGRFLRFTPLKQPNSGHRARSQKASVERSRHVGFTPDSGRMVQAPSQPCRWLTASRARHPLSSFQVRGGRTRSAVQQASAGLYGPPSDGFGGAIADDVDALVHDVHTAFLSDSAGEMLCLKKDAGWVAM